MLSPARVAAYQVLLAVELGRADLPDALADARSSLGDERDRALAAEIATGALRWQGQIDALIGHFGRRPVSRLDVEVRTILRLSAYQVLHLSRVPAAAATDDAVTLTKRVLKGSAAGFVNAVLRSIVRSRGRLPLPPRPAPAAVARLGGDADARDAALDYLSVTLSHPRWLVARWLDREGFDAAERWTAFNNWPAPLTLRANRLKTSATELAARLAACGVVTTPGAYAPDALIVGDGNPLRTPLAGQGLFFVQDEASQLVGLLAACRPARWALDCCASPGGKTTAMAAAMAESGAIVAADLRPRRIDLLRRTVAQSGARRVHLVQCDADRALPFAAPGFDLVLLDAPCSGLGTIRRDPEIRWRRREADLARLGAAQARMIANAAAVVKPGGRLVYATCSSEPEENDAVIAEFLRGHATFSPADPRRQPIDPGLARVLDEGGRLRTSPPAHGLEAFFAVVLERALL